jgi:diguanylate cyclase (GGDEF)-like protein
MSRVFRSYLLLFLVSLAVAGAVFATAQLQRSAAMRASAQQDIARLLLTDMLDQETGLRGYILSREESFAGPYEDGRARFAQDVTRARRLIPGGESRRALEASLKTANRWIALADDALASSRAGSDAPQSLGSLQRRKLAMDGHRGQHAVLRDALRAESHRSSRRAEMLSLLVSLVLCLSLGAAALGLMRRQERTQRRIAEEVEAYRDSQDELAGTMQVVRSEPEAHGLLKRHLERCMEAAVVVLSRNNSADRLEPTTAVEDPDLLAALDGATPDSCVAVRLGRPHTRDAGAQPLLACSICGARPGSTACRPLLVSGEVIGSVLVESGQPLDQRDAQRLRDSVAQAAPVLGNLRNLAIAETRAATDALTGLPNRRAVQDTLRRMIAQAGRSAQPMAVIAIDLDHFKDINDRFGHGKGDEVLAAAGAALQDCVRESDFAGRVGGEEFVVLAADSDATGGMVLAESLRGSIARLHVPEVERAITASLGVAAFPEAGIDAESLLRAADRALYRAKDRGRDRVEVAPHAGMPRRPDPRPGEQAAGTAAAAADGSGESPATPA